MVHILPLVAYGKTGNFWFDQGEYELVFQGYGSIPNYKLRIVTPDLPTITYTIGDTISGAIPDKGGQQYYTFTGIAGQKLFYDNLGSDYFRLRIYDPAGRSIVSDGWWTDNADNRVDYGPDRGLTLSMNGTYRIFIDGEGEGTGNYKFRLLNLETAPIVGLNTDITGTFDNNATGAVPYRFNLTERKYIYFDALQGDGAWTVYRQNGTYVTSGRLWEDRELWLDAGEYLLVPYGYGVDANYKMQIVADELPTTAYTLGDTVADTIAKKGSSHTYTFTGVAGQRLYLDSQILASGLRASITNPSGRSLFGEFDLNTNGDHDVIVLDETGTYSLLVDAVNENTGSYRFKLIEYGDTATMPTAVNFNTNITGTFSDPNKREADLYRFTSAGKQHIYVDALAGDYYNNYWEIYKPNGENLVLGRLSEDKEVDLDAAGQYTLVLRGGGSVDNNYEVRLISAEPAVTNYTLGTTVNSNISNKGEIDTYTFDGSVGQFLLFDALTGNGNIKGRLYSPTGALLVDRDTGSDWSPLILGEQGTYRLVIDGAGETTGDYSFRISNRADATVLTTGTAITDSLDVGNGIKLYQFVGTAGKTINFDLLGQTLPTTIDSATGHAYALTEVGETWTAAKAKAKAMGGDLVTINSADENQFLVNTFGGSEGFWIGMTDEAQEGNWQWTSGEPVTFTNWGSGEPNDYGNEDYAAINWGGAGRWNDLSAGGVLRGIVENDGSTPITSNIWKTGNWVLYDPSGVAIATPNSNNPDFNVALAANGVYTLAITSSNNSTVDYSFQVNDVTPTPIAHTGFNTVSSGTFNTPGQVNSYTFNANAGTVLQYDGMDATDWWVRVRLVNPNGTYAFGDGEARGDRSPVTLQQTGTYKLEFYNYYYWTDWTGNYKFKLLELPKNFGPGVNYLEIGSPVAGTLNNGESKIYTFQANPGMDIMFNGMTGDDVSAYLYDANGNKVFNIDNFRSYDSGLHTLKRGDIYNLVISAAQNATRHYSFQLLENTTAPEVTYNLPVNGALDNGQKSFLYKLHAEKGQTLYFDNLSFNAPGYPWPYEYRWILYSPNNSVLSNQELRNDFQVEIPENGEYSLYIQGVSWTNPYDYKFRVFSHDPDNQLDVITPGKGGTLSNADGSVGEFAVKLQVKDSVGASSTQDYTIRLWPTPLMLIRLF